MLTTEHPQASRGSSRGTTPRRQILIIEDDETLIKLLRTALELPAYEVHAVRCGTTALAYTADSRPDLVILDLGLPDMNGYDVCRKLHQPQAGTPPPILILSGLDAPADQQLGFACGADAYLTKPYKAEDLEQLVTRLIGALDASSQSNPSTPEMS